MRFSVITVTWECADALGRLVASMNEHVDVENELVVVDNASSDDPERALGHWGGKARFCRLDENLGFGMANNIGIEQAGEDVVVLLNPDTELVDDSLASLADQATRARWLVGPRILNSDGTVQPSASGPPVGVWPWVRVIMPGALAPAPLVAKLEPWRLRDSHRVTWLSGACIAARRAVLRQIGPFDPSIHLYSEDLDLGMRASTLGVESWFCPDVATIVHHGKQSTMQRFDDRGKQVAAVNERAVLARSSGIRAERAAWWARRAALRVRIIAKRIVGRDAAHDLQVLEAIKSAREFPVLPTSG